VVSGCSILISCLVTPQVTRFLYYIGAVIGIGARGMVLDFWNRGNKRDAGATEIRRYL